jgi:ribosomal protein S20
MEMGISADPFNFDVEAQDYAKYLSEAEVASYKEMQEDERERIVREREREIREAQTDNYNDLMWKMVSDQGTPSPQNVISMVRNGTLSKGQGATLIQMSRKVLDAQMERNPAGSGDLVRQLADSIDKNLSPDDPGYVSTDEVAKWIAEGKVHKDQIASYKADLTNLQSVEGQVNRDRKSMGRTLVKNAIDEEGLDIKDEFAGEKLLADYNHKIASIEAYKGVLDENDGVLVATSLIKDYILDNDLKLDSWFFGANTSAGDVMEEVDRILAEIQKFGAADDLDVTPEPELSEESPSRQAVKPEPKESLDSIFGSAGE